MVFTNTNDRVILMTNIIEFITVPIGAFLLVAIPLLAWAKREMWD